MKSLSTIETKEKKKKNSPKTTASAQTKAPMRLNTPAEQNELFFLASKRPLTKPISENRPKDNAIICQFSMKI